MNNSQNRQRLLWFALGTFLGGWVLGLLGGLVGGLGGKKR